MKVSFDGITLIDGVYESYEVRKRMRGLLGLEGLPERTAMLIAPCSSIHTWFMRFSIDLIFLDRENRVVKVCRNVRPWRMVSGGFKAAKVLEMEAGWADLSRVKCGAIAGFHA